VAMIPVNREQAKQKKSKKNPNGWEMPEKNLFTRLKERTRGRVLLADEPDKIELEKRCNDQYFIDNVKFENGSLVKTAGSTPEPLYIELTIEG